MHAIVLMWMVCSGLRDDKLINELRPLQTDNVIPVIQSGESCGTKHYTEINFDLINLAQSKIFLAAIVRSYCTCTTPRQMPFVSTPPPPNNQVSVLQHPLGRISCLPANFVPAHRQQSIFTSKKTGTSIAYRNVATTNYVPVKSSQ